MGSRLRQPGPAGGRRGDGTNRRASTGSASCSRSLKVVKNSPWEDRRRVSDAQVNEYRFDRFALRPNERRLLVDGEPARLGARAFDLLLALIERRERTVTRAELFELVWPGRVVEDQNLQVQVVALRKLLGPAAIATVPGRGYRFALSLRPEQPAAATSVTAATTPAPAAPGRPPLTNLPAELPPLYGRTQDLVAVSRLLQEHRLVTLTGPGGIGKTRLAMAVAHPLRPRFPDGVWIVELAALADGELVAGAIARTLGVAPGKGPMTPESVARSLASLDALLVLDNCEHLLGAAGACVAASLAGAPRLRWLVTSQEPLHIAGEQVARLAPLAVPTQASTQQAAEYGAVSLFTARVRALLPAFTLTEAATAAAIEICRELDGIPLALELAAARVPLLGVEGVRARLDERFRLLTAGSRDAPARQQTLRAALEWSHGLLSADEQAVFRRLGAFAGSFALPAAQQVAAGDVIDGWAVLDHLGALVDKSLVQVLDGASPRYRLLESARAFAVERLAAAGEADAIRRRHAEATLQWLQQLVERAIDLPTFDWQDLIVADLENLRGALAWARHAAAQGDAAAAELQLALVAWGVPLWHAAGAWAEALAAVDAAQPLLSAATPPAVQARFWQSVAHLGGSNVVPPLRGLAAGLKALALHESLGDAVNQYWTLNFVIPQANWLQRQDFDSEAALARMRALEAPDWTALRRRPRRMTQGSQLMRAGRWLEFRDAMRAEFDLLQQCGDLRNAWLAAANLCLALLLLDEAAEAVQLMRAVVAQVRATGRVRQSWQAIGMLGASLIAAGERDEADAVMLELLDLQAAAGATYWGIEHWPALLALRGEPENAARLLGWSDAMGERLKMARGPLSQKIHERLQSRLAACLPADRLRALMAEGERLGDDAVRSIVRSRAPR